IFKDTNKGYKEIDFYYVLEFALLEPLLSWKAANNRYRLNVSSDEQKYFSSLACPGGSKSYQDLKVKLGFENNSAQSFFAMRKPDVLHVDLSVFSGNSVKEPYTFVEPNPSEFLMTGVEQPDSFPLQGLNVETKKLHKRRRFEKADGDHNRIQKPHISPRVEPVPPSTRRVFSRIMAAKDPPTSSVLNAIIVHQSRWTRVSSIDSPRGDSSPGRSSSPSRSLSPSSGEDDDDSEGENNDDNIDGSPGPSSLPKRRIFCSHDGCRSNIHSDKAMKQHLKDAHQDESKWKYFCLQPGCNAKFPRKTNLMRHEKGHDPRNLSICELCGQSFTRKSNMEKHQEKVDGKVVDCKGNTKKK
ncbi:hypothetical protein BGZ95_007352, partial [Linnemannia exigua]